MSYCRFSTSNHASEVYAYEAVGGGYSLSVAKYRFVDDGTKPAACPFPTTSSEEDIKDFLRQQKVLSKWLEQAQREEISLPHAGEHFSFETLEELRDFLMMLKSIGYHVPDEAFASIESEIKEKESE